MAFSIQFIDRRKKIARIEVGSFCEQFKVSSDKKTIEQEMEWCQELQKLLRMLSRSVAIPVWQNRQVISRAWLLYRVENVVFIQDQIFPKGFDKKKNRIPIRKTVNCEGEKISEWHVTISQIKAFLNLSNKSMHPTPHPRSG